MFERRTPETDSDDNTASRSDATDEESQDEDQTPPSPPPLADPRQKDFLVSLKDFWDSVKITVFVIGGAAILFIAASNTITW